MWLIQEMAQGRHHDGLYMGMHWGWWIFWILLLVVVVWAVVRFATDARRG